MSLYDRFQSLIDPQNPGPADKLLAEWDRMREELGADVADKKMGDLFEEAMRLHHAQAKKA